MNIMNIKKIVYAMLALPVLAGAVHAEPVAPCVRQIALAQSRIYACERILNYHAETATPVLTDMLVIMRKSIDAHGPFLVFGTNENKEICGSIRLHTIKFDKTNVEAADAVLVLQDLVFEAFRAADSEILEGSHNIADSVIDTPSEPQNERRARALQNISAAIKTLDRKMRAAVGKKELEQYAPDRCGAIVSNSGISLPVVRGPDLIALAKYKDAMADYAKFDAWLTANTVEKP